MALSVGIVGLRRGLSLARALDALPECTVVAGCDPNERALAGFSEEWPSAKAFTSYKDMLNGHLDVVAVASPIPFHREHSTQALEAGCHVLQEVTLGATVEDCEALVKAVTAHPRQKFMLAENNCYIANIMSWSEMWAAGQLGDFVYAEAEYVHDIRPLLRNPDGTPAWRATRPPIVYCTHSLGPLLKVTGQRCVSATALGTGSRFEPDLQHIDMQVAIFSTSGGGAIKVLRAQAVAREPMFHYYSIYGTKGCLETRRPPDTRSHSYAYIETIPHLETMIDMPLGEDVADVPTAAVRGGHGTREYFMVKDFVGCVVNDSPPPIDVFAGAAMTLPGLCAHESSCKGGAPVAVPDLR